MFEDLFSSLAGLFGGGGADAASAAATAAPVAADTGSFLGALGGIGPALSALGSLGSLGLNIYGATQGPQTAAPQPLSPSLMPPPPLLATSTPRRGTTTAADLQAGGLSGAAPDFFTLMNQSQTAYNPYGYSFQPGTGQAPWPYGAGTIGGA